MLPNRSVLRSVLLWHAWLSLSLSLSPGTRPEISGTAATGRILKFLHRRWLAVGQLTRIAPVPAAGAPTGIPMMVPESGN